MLVTTFKSLGKMPGQNFGVQDCDWVIVFGVDFQITFEKIMTFGIPT
jgi:hypothetical protein